MGFSVSNGVKTVRIANSTRDDFPVVDESEEQTTGGSITSQQSGVRYTATERNIRFDEPGLKELVDLLTDGSSSYIYTPDKPLPAFVDASEFPMRARIQCPVKQGQAWGGEEGKVHYVSVFVRGIEYL